MRRYGMTTIARWLSEELPKGVTAYIENNGRLFELMKLVAVNGKLAPELRMLADKLGRFTPVGSYVSLDTKVILSLSENLAGIELATIAGQLAPAATGSWAMPLAPVEGKATTDECLDSMKICSSMFCG